MKKGPPDPFRLVTPSITRFNAGLQDWYESSDGFRHTLSGNKKRMTTKCIACGDNRTDPYSTVQTKDNELIAAEVAHWQMNHRIGCQVPRSAITIQ